MVQTEQFVGVKVDIPETDVNLTMTNAKKEGRRSAGPEVNVLISSAGSGACAHPMPVAFTVKKFSRRLPL